MSIENENPILKSLLARQGMKQLMQFRKPENCKIDKPLFGYIKDLIFYVCDEALSLKSRKDLGLREKGSLLICIVNGEYSVSETIKGMNNFVISEQGAIIVENPEKYSYINSECFIIGNSQNLEDGSDGLIMDCKIFQHNISSQTTHNCFKRPHIADCDIEGEEHHGNYYTENPGVVIPTIVVQNDVYIRGTLNKEVIYLFSAKKRTFLYDKIKKTFIVYEDEQYRRLEKNECQPDYIWISKKYAHLISVHPTENVDNSDFADTIELKSHHISTKEIKLDTSISIYRNKEVAASAQCLLIEFEDGGYNYSSGVFIIIDGDGNLCYSERRDYGEWEFVNNLLMIKEQGQSEKSYYDCFGNLIAEESGREYSQYAVAEQIASNLPYYNSSDLTMYRKNQDGNVRDTVNRDLEKLNVRQGVINLVTGRILIPIMFSGVKTKNIREPFSTEEYPSYKQITIVWIDNFNIKKISYYGLYTDDKLFIPIFYDRIGFIQYDFYEKGSKKSYRKGDTKFLYIEKNGYFGVLDCWGREILPVEASKVKSLSDNNYSDYVLAYNENGYIRLIYRNRIISEYEYTSAEAIEPSALQMEYAIQEQIVKLKSEETETSFVYQGKTIASHLMGEISVFGCNILCGDDGSKLRILFVEEYDSFKRIYDSNGNEVITCEDDKIIEIRKSFISIDGIVYGDEMKEVINLQSAELLNSIRNYNGTLRAYHTSEGKYLFLYFDDWTVNFEEVAAEDANGKSDKYIDWQYNFENNEFIYIPDDTESYCDYPDDTDYERDTYYALGGDDYDAFKERGGSIDDMMDYLGY